MIILVLMIQKYIHKTVGAVNENKQTLKDVKHHIFIA
jgi:hypothetical protein